MKTVGKILFWQTKREQRPLVIISTHFRKCFLTKTSYRDFPGGTVVNNPPANAGDTGLMPGPGRCHMPLSN